MCVRRCSLSAMVALVAFAALNCGGARILAVVERSSVRASPEGPVRIYIREVDLTGGAQAQYEVPTLLSYVVPRLQPKRIEVRDYYVHPNSGVFTHSKDFHRNPFVLVPDSADADLFATVRISILDHLPERELQSATEAVGQFLAFGVLSLLGGNESRGVMGADCEIRDVETHELIHESAFGAISDRHLELSKRQALKLATERSVEGFLRGLFREE